MQRRDQTSKRKHNSSTVAVWKALNQWISTFSRRGMMSKLQLLSGVLLVAVVSTCRGTGKSVWDNNVVNYKKKTCWEGHVL